MTKDEKERLYISLCQSVQVIVANGEQEKLERYLLLNYKTRSIDGLRTFQYHDVFCELYRWECEIRDQH